MFPGAIATKTRCFILLFYSTVFKAKVSVSHASPLVSEEVYFLFSSSFWCGMRHSRTFSCMTDYCQISSVSSGHPSPMYFDLFLNFPFQQRCQSQCILMTLIMSIINLKHWKRKLKHICWRNKIYFNPWYITSSNRNRYAQP